MKKVVLFILCLGLLVPAAKAQQISTDTNVSLTDLVESLLGTDCVEISNINSPHNGTIDGISSFGAFDRASSNFPFSNGIILTTGDVSASGNSVISAPLNAGTANWGTDADLEATLGINTTLNATSVEFEFVSAANTVQFNYILASEEYQQEYPCFYSDGFAILLKEAGTSDPFTNIALIPGTNIPVNTNNIHDTIEGFCDAVNEEFFEGYNVGDTNYNGRTTVLTATANIVPNTSYIIKFVIADETDERFDSAVFIQGNSFNAAVDLGPDIDTCASEIILNADIGNSLSVYEWFLNGNSLVSSANPTLSVNESGEYRVVVTSPIGSGSCIIEDTVNVQIEQEVSVGTVSEMITCDDSSNDGIETFDLSTKISELEGLVSFSNSTISFHESIADAENNVNPLTTNYQNTSSPQIIYVRIEDADSGCLAFPSFELIVNPLPTPVSLPPFLACQSQMEEDFTPIDLSMFDDQFSESNPDILVSYHSTQNDASAGLNPLEMPYNNPNVSEVIYVRLENTSSGCINTTSIQIDFSSSLNIPNQGAFIDLCLDETEEFGVFDLTSVVPGLLNGLTGVTVTFHESFTDAELGINPITNPTTYQNTTPNFQQIFIRFEDDSTQCPTISTVELHVNLLNNAFPDEFTSDICDDVSNDGIGNFNLETVKNEVSQGLLDLDIQLYATISDLNSQSNPLDDSVPYEVTGGQDIIYAEILSESCSTTIEVTLLINDATIVNPVTITYCDDAINDGITEIILSDLDTPTLQGIDPGTVNYFLTIDDANNNTNEIGGSIINSSNPQRFYVRITNSLTQCTGVTHIDVSVIDRPVVNTPSPLASCDLDGDGINVVNLDTKVSEIVSDPSLYSFSFFLSIEDAESDLNPINDAENFQTSSTDVFVKVRDNNTSCFEVVPLSIIVNTFPEVIDVETFISCETSGTGTAEFLLSDKDAEILNDQTDKVVLYFENESDALTGSNSIDASIVYENTSNPQTLYYRIENITDPNCNNTGSFNLEVRPVPIYNVPSDIFVCNNDGNDNYATIDLNESLSEISNGSPDTLNISFHPSELDAENNLNPHPLLFTNSSNPEPIFARIENQAGCVSIQPFEMNVVALPLINPAPDLEQCDTDYDGQVPWDLTQVETEVLSIRQDNIEIGYFESLSELEQGINEISNPENYINSSIQETVYIKVTNTISNCYSYEPILLSVSLPPPINEFMSYEICADISNTVDLSLINWIVYSGDFNDVSIKYFSSYQDAENDINGLPEVYNYNSLNETLYVRVEDNSSLCSIIYQFQLIINEAPIPGPVENLESCDDDFDGIVDFNFSGQTASILQNSDPNSHTVTYYSSQENAMDDINPLPSTYFASNDEVIFFRLQETATSCYTIGTFSTIVHEKPNVSIPTQTLCIDVGSTIVSAETGIDGETYLWSTGEESSSIEITETGTYEVTVTSPFGCETTSAFEVIPSESAFVDIIETVDFSDPNNIIITVSGSGDYLYSLDGGSPQESNVFENVSLGFHTITISDKNGCASVVRPVVVVDAPKYFTPNNDGRNDTWHISGIETIPGTSISIFDRFGKLMSIIDSNTEGWDGRYNGNNMPATDYWFVADVVKDNERFQVKGHFALRR